MDAPDELRRRFLEWSWPLANCDVGEVATWRLEHASGRARYLKVAVASRFPRVVDEGARMRWARACLPVPQVLDCATDGQVD